MEYPRWLQVILALCMGTALAGLGAWLLFTTVANALHAAARLEDIRTHKETEALNNWTTAYDAEHEEHLQDVAELTDRILTLEREARLKDKLLSKVKVADL